MRSKYRVGIIGFAHMHINSVAAQYAAHPKVELVAGADTRPLRTELRIAPYTREWNQRHAVERWGVKLYEDYRTMLADETFDMVIVTSENAQHPDVVQACAAAGVHVCVEKPMAMSLSGALRMVRACQTAGTTLVVNWPLTWSPAAREAKSLIDQGAIGRVLEVRWRSGHRGPLGRGVSHPGVDQGGAPMTGAERGATWWHQKATGGGAMLDYCCYGAMVARWYVGEQALAAMGMRANLDSHWGNADDNAMMMVRFPSAMAIFEGSWTTHHHGVPTGPIVHGTEGTLVVDTQDGQPVVRVERGEGQTEVRLAAPLPEGQATVAEAFIHHLDTGEPLHTTLEMMFNLEAMAILDAGVRSAESNALALIENATWCIG